MKYLILSDIFFPEKRLITEEIYLLCDALIKRKQTVVLGTYNIKSKNEDSIFDLEATQNGYKIIRSGISNLKKRHLFIRAIFELINPLLLCLKLLPNIIFANRIIVFSPSIFLSLFSILLARLFNKKIILCLQDIIPQNLIDLGIIKNKFLVMILHSIENINYKYSDVIFVNTFKSKEYLIQKKYILSKKIRVFYPWINSSKYNHNNLIDKSEFGKKFNIPITNDDLIITFTGNIGPFQNLEILFEISKYLENSKIKFLIFGDGRGTKLIKEKIRDNKNINIFHHLPIFDDNFYNLLKISDFGLATLDKRNSTCPIPGKIFEYMYNQLPIIALVDKNHDDLNIILGKNERGVIIDPDEEPPLIAMKIKDLIKNKINFHQMGKNGKAFAEKNFMASNLLEEFIDSTLEF